MGCNCWQLARLQGACWVNCVKRGGARRQVLKCPWVLWLCLLAVSQEVIGVAERGGEIEGCG